MTKEWWIKLNEEEEGPFDYYELKKDTRLTPDTLVRKINTTQWIPIRYVTELQEIFEEETKNNSPDLSTSQDLSSIGQEQATLTLQQDPFPLFLWLLLLVIIIFYILYYLP